MLQDIFETNIIGIIIFVLILVHFQRYRKDRISATVLNKMITCVTIAMSADTLAFMHEGKLFQGSQIIINSLMMIYFFAGAFAAYYWLIYTHFRIYKRLNFKKVRPAILYAPMLIVISFVAVSPYTHWIFYYDINNFYHRGPIYLVQPMMSSIYIAAAVMMSLKSSFHAVTNQRRRNSLSLCVYTFFPIIGGLVQVFNNGVNTLTPSVVISLVILYIDNMNQEISIDPLTKLNNRGQFDNFLAEIIKAPAPKNLHLIFFDVNDFKQINDTFGHVEGDRALVFVADALKHVFADYKAFIARYGGDEFAVLIQCDFKKIEALVDELDKNLADASEDLPYYLMVAGGCSKFGDENTKTAEKLIKVADMRMYECKERLKLKKIDEDITTA